MGTYPSFAFTPDDSAIVIWAAGQIWSVPLTSDLRGEKVAHGKPSQISFKASIEKRLAKTLRPETNILKTETASNQRVYAFKELDVADDGLSLVFNAAGVTVTRAFNPSTLASASGAAGELPSRPVPVTDSTAAYYTPSFVPHRPNLILHARWSDVNLTSFELGDVSSGKAYALTGLPFGRYYAPVLCQCLGTNRKIAFVRLGGDLGTGDIVATAGVGLYIGDVQLPDHDHANSQTIPISNLRFIPSEIEPYTPLKMRFRDGASTLVVQQSDRAFTINLKSGPNAYGDYAHTTISTGLMSSEIAAAPGRERASSPVAFIDFMHVYLLAKPESNGPFWSKPGKAPPGLARLSLDGGHDIVFSPDGQRLFWLLGVPVQLRVFTQTLMLS